MAMTLASAAPFFREPAAGSTLDVLGVTHIYKATGAETVGSFSLWEAIVPPGAGAPLHTHGREDESFYILSGELLVELEGEPAPRRARRLLLRRARPTPCLPQCRRSSGARPHPVHPELRPRSDVCRIGRRHRRSHA